MAERFSNPVPQFLDSAGKPFIDGLAYYYLSGTNTFQDTFADANLSIPNTNPVVLGADGRLPNVWLKSASYNVIITGTDSVTGLLTQIWQRDPVGGEGIEGNFSVWNALTVYNSPDIVSIDDKFYQSITNQNQGNNPTTSPAEWEEIKFVGVWNINKTYPLDYVVQGSNGFLYISLTASNTGNDPVTDSVNWGAPVNTDIELALTQATVLSFP